MGLATRLLGYRDMRDERECIVIVRAPGRDVPVYLTTAGALLSERDRAGRFAEGAAVRRALAIRARPGWGAEAVEAED